MKKRKTKQMIVVIILTASIVVFMGISASLANAGRSNPITDAVQLLFSPAQRVFFKAGRSVGGFFEAVSDAYTHKEENEQLQTEITVLKQETKLMESFKQENERLRELLNFKESCTEYDMVGCEVIAKNAGNWFHTFKIDKGKSSGIHQGNVVLQHHALLGKVTEVGNDWATVTSIMEPESSVGALVTRTQSLAIAEGDLALSHKGKIRLSFLADNAEPVVGDSVETSGIGGVYPRGLIIGTVSEILTDGASNIGYAVLDTEAEFDCIREVMVILSQNRNGERQ